jgi:hypothetical protein
MEFNLPVFDIFKELPDRDAVWIERGAGLGEARERMEQIAKEAPGPYFVFSPTSHSVLARHVEPPSSTSVTDGYCVFRTLDEGGALKIGWRRDHDQALQLVAHLGELWPAEYFILPANEDDVQIA